MLTRPELPETQRFRRYGTLLAATLFVASAAYNVATGEPGFTIFRSIALAVIFIALAFMSWNDR